MKIIFLMAILSTSGHAFADENSEIFRSFKQEYCANSSGIQTPREILDACVKASSYTDLKAATDKFVTKCLDKAAGQPTTVIQCNKDVFYIETVAKAYFAGAKANGCKKSSAPSAGSDGDSGKK